MILYFYCRQVDIENRLRYERQLEDMEGRLQERPLLFERTPHQEGGGTHISIN